MTHALTSKGERKVSTTIPRGLIVVMYNTALPSGWVLCDGTNGTPDLTDRIVVGDTVIGTGSSGGSGSPASALTHAGMAVAAHSSHVVTQASDHAAHVVTQAAAHSDHVVTQAGNHGTHAANATHTHDNHTTGGATALNTTVLTGPTTHAANATHTHDAHSAHVGAALGAHSSHSGAGLGAHSSHSAAALDAHSAHAVTQPSDHAVPKHYRIAWAMWRAA